MTASWGARAGPAAACLERSADAPERCARAAFGANPATSLSYAGLPSVDRSLPLARSPWVPGRLRVGLPPGATPPSSEMFALYGTGGCAIFDDAGSPDGEPGVSVGAAGAGVGARDFSTAHENGHCAGLILSGMGVSTGLGDEALADLFALWAVWAEGGRESLERAGRALAGARGRAAGTIHARQSPGLVAALSNVLASPPAGGSGFVAFLSKAGVCDGRVCGGSSPGVASRFRAGWFATVPGGGR